VSYLAYALQTCFAALIPLDEVDRGVGIVAIDLVQFGCEVEDEFVVLDVVSGIGFWVLDALRKLFWSA
jgi:hypothetical protein